MREREREREEQEAEREERMEGGRVGSLKPEVHFMQHLCHVGIKKGSDLTVQSSSLEVRVFWNPF